uniref:Uncharacterized protein n=1 Tax=Anguilla anguilla TaxID=7936 RepID=A0A0E9QFM5_ANGAN
MSECTYFRNLANRLGKKILEAILQSSP